MVRREPSVAVRPIQHARKVSLDQPISRDRAEFIGRAQACSRCLEYSFKKVSVKPAPDSQQKELHTLWIVRRICGICEHESELGLDPEGDVVYLG